MADFQPSHKTPGSRTALSDTLTFGLTLTIVGMAGTMLSLWLLSLLTTALKKIFPLAREHHTRGTEK